MADGDQAYFIGALDGNNPIALKTLDLKTILWNNLVGIPKPLPASINSGSIKGSVVDGNIHTAFPISWMNTLLPRIPGNRYPG